MKTEACHGRRLAALFGAGFLVAFPASFSHADYTLGLKAHQTSDYKTAFTEWLAAANAGDPKAQFALGKLYEDGLGVLRNLIEAHRWYNLSAAGGNVPAKTARDALEARMSKDEIASASKLASEWKPLAAGSTSPPNETPTTGSTIPSPESEAVDHFKSGLSSLRSGKLDEAISEFTAGLKIKPDAVALFFLGEAYRSNNQLDLSLKSYAESLALDSKSVVSEQARQSLLAVKALDAPPTEKQIADVQKLLKSLGYYAGGVDGKPGPRTEAAVKVFQKSEKLVVNGKITSDLAMRLEGVSADRAAKAGEFFKQGFDALQAKRTDDAITKFKAGMALKPDAQAGFYLGEAYRTQGMTAQALEWYRKSLSLDPKSPVASKAREAEKLAAGTEKPPAPSGKENASSQSTSGPNELTPVEAAEKLRALLAKLSASSDPLTRKFAHAWALFDNNGKVYVNDDGSLFSPLVKQLKAGCRPGPPEQFFDRLHMIVNIYEIAGNQLIMHHLTAIGDRYSYISGKPISITRSDNGFNDSSAKISLSTDRQLARVGLDAQILIAQSPASNLRYAKCP